MIGKNALVKAAVCAFLALALASCMTAQQAAPPASGSGAQRPNASTSGAGTTTAHVDQGPQPDPNMPAPRSPLGLAIEWYYISDPTNPVVRFFDPPAATPPMYLGFNDQGSWFANGAQRGQVYVWNGKSQTLTRQPYKNEREIPEEVLASLKNFQAPALLARFKKTAQAPTAPPTQAAANTPPPAKGDGLFDPNAVRSALSGLQNQPGGTGSGQIAGTEAAVQGGVLTFTKANNTKATYKVVRPAANTPQPAGIAGTWVAMEGNGMGILFSVQPDGSVTGREMPAQIIQALMQSAAR